MSVDTAEPSPALAAPDGRSTRWAAHRRARRAELVSAAVRAISSAGPDVGMDEIAALAGTSKTVLYRHFSDKGELHAAVGQRVDERVSAALRAASTGAADFRAGLRAVIRTYLQLVTDDPNVYRFVTSRAGSGADPIAGLSAAVSAELTRLIGRHLRAGGLSRGVSAVWAHGLVGMVRAGADHWLEASEEDVITLPGAGGGAPLDVEQMADALTDLAWGGLSPALVPSLPPGHSSSDPDLPPAGTTDTTDTADTADTDVLPHHQEQP